jgi:hypothetical protein
MMSYENPIANVKCVTQNRGTLNAPRSVADEKGAWSQAIMCRPKAGIVPIPGVYVRIGDKIPLGSAVNKASQSRPARPTFSLHEAAHEKERSRLRRSELLRLTFESTLLSAALTVALLSSSECSNSHRDLMHRVEILLRATNVEALRPETRPQSTNRIPQSSHPRSVCP